LYSPPLIYLYFSHTADPHRWPALVAGDLKNVAPNAPIASHPSAQIDDR